MLQPLYPETIRETPSLGCLYGSKPKVHPSGAHTSRMPKQGIYTHSTTANVKVSDVGSNSMVLSAPSLLDLLTDDNEAPADREVLEQAFLDQPDPYDLAETDRVDAAIHADPADELMVFCSTACWAVADYVKLDSPALAELILPRKTDLVAQKQSVARAEADQIGDEDDWDVDDNI
ncbi:hypothetical protein DFH05DRAFT_1525933 [Lentinula detonsa]|uniref:Uncharacterized protein n=1 Tax=Lentinula detonsa TaxID=2804962 RepID=A0A9W8NYZ2_9AGAR|nr:hypothetical protein DFH05DRAFT_1525933 [Lentinula detonsa]